MIIIFHHSHHSDDLQKTYPLSVCSVPCAKSADRMTDVPTGKKKTRKAIRTCRGTDPETLEKRNVVYARLGRESVSFSVNEPEKWNASRLVA